MSVLANTQLFKLITSWTGHEMQTASVCPGTAEFIMAKLAWGQPSALQAKLQKHASKQTGDVL